MSDQNFYASNDLGYAQLSVSSPAVYAGAGKFGSSQISGIPVGTVFLRVTIEGNPVRWRADGVAPTASVGKPLAVGSELIFNEAQLPMLQFIAQSGSATINLSAFGNQPSSAIPFTPAQLFLAGDLGAWYDASDFSSMFQDVLATVPVTAVGQSVARINDKSGNSNYLVQATASLRPTILVSRGGHYYLQYDGVNDTMSTAAPIGLSSPEFECVAGWYSGASGQQALFTNLRYQIISSGTSLRFTTPAVKDYTTATGVVDANTPFVMGCLYDSSFGVTFRKNGVALPFIAGTSDGSIAQNNLQLGSVGGAAPLAGRIYQFVVIKRRLNSDERAATEGFINAKTGAF